MKIIFMGTPDFAVEILDALLEAGHEISLVVTKPDKPRGRKKLLTPPEVKQYATEHGIEVFQPAKIRRAEAVAKLAQYPADVAVVAAFGQILPEEILKMPRLGCVNVHASLLPRYRGAAPIQWAVLNGDAMSGVTTMQMGVGLDDGDILEQEEIPLDPHETGASLFARLAAVSRGLIVRTLEDLDAGRIQARPQDPGLVSHVGMIRKDMGRLDFSRPAEELERMIRGLNSWPSAFTSYQGETLKIWRAGVLEDECPSAEDPRDEEDRRGPDAARVPQAISTIGSSAVCPGKIFALTDDAIYVKCGRGLLRIEELQKAGKKMMPAADFLRGHRMEVGQSLGQ